MAAAIDISTAAAEHLGAHAQAITASVENGTYGQQTRQIAFAANSEINPDGSLKHGALLRIDANTPLSNVRAQLGPVLHGRLGMYKLSSAPNRLKTPSEFERKMKETDLPATIDDHGEEYGPFSAGDAPGTPWVPVLNNGHSADSYVSLALSESNPDSYALFVHSNSTQQALDAIDSALRANPTITVGQFASSAPATRLRELATMENQRIAGNVAARLGISNLLQIATTSEEKTSTDQYAADVRYAVPHAMMNYGDLRSARDSTVRVSNMVFDLDTPQGRALVLPHSPYHGFLTLSAPRAAARSNDLAPIKSRTEKSIAISPLRGTPTEMSSAALENMSRVMHAANWDETVAAQIGARMSTVPPKAKCYSKSQLELAGLGHLCREIYRPIGTIVFP